MWDWQNIIVYIIFIVAAIFLLRMDNKDNRCLSPFSPEEECDNGRGMPFQGSKPQPGDDCNTLLDRINRAAGAEGRSIKWRRSFVLAVVIGLGVILLVTSPGKLTHWPQFLIIVLIAFSVIYWSFNYYSYHIFSVPEKNINEAVDRLRKMCK